MHLHFYFYFYTYFYFPATCLTILTNGTIAYLQFMNCPGAAFLKQWLEDEDDNEHLGEEVIT